MDGQTATATAHRTRVLLDACHGDTDAADTLLELVYDDLRRLAAAYMGQERGDHTLQPTALVHEAYLKLIQQTRVDWAGRAHFFAIAAQAIRRILVDHARARRAAKRGANRGRLTLSGLIEADAPTQVDLLALDDALQRLEQLHPRQFQVVQLRYFGGLTGAETAEVLGVDRSTVADDWCVARAWLAVQLGDRR